MPTFAEQEQLIARLASSPARFQALLAGLGAAGTVTKAAAGQWSPHEIVARMRAANDILEPRVLQVLVRPNTPLIGFDEERWLQVLDYSNQPIADLLETMSWRRKELLHALQNISPEAWERTGIHEVRGPMTVFELAAQIADHEDDHLAQIELAIGEE